MAATYPRHTSGLAMISRRRAWKHGDGFEVIGRSGNRYHVDVTGGIPHCECPAGSHGRPCWHAATVLRRLAREKAS